MGRKIFVSYKHNDRAVASEVGIQPTTARNYVDVLEKRLEVGDHIYKGERNNEDISGLKEATIADHLCDKMYDSSVTIVMISKGMKAHLSESDQWIPWEISYSLKEMSRGGRTSATNAMLAIVLPDEYRSYDYFIQQSMCQSCRCSNYRTDILFEILRRNMFNRKNPTLTTCNLCGSKLYYDKHPSYIHVATWSEFISNPNHYIETAIKIKEDSDSYDIVKEIG
ncbi:MAG: TIR domain-containing protein [Pseudomonadota bacterium]|nr:TIR domain-containing protein [Pseudomonadota bacterium]